MKMQTQRVNSYYRYLIHNWGIMNCSFCQMSRCRDGTFNMKVCQNAHLLFLCTKPRLSQAGALLLPKDFVSLGIRISL